MAGVRVRNLWKVFGRKPDEAVRLAQAGQSRETILRETGSTVGVADVSFDIADGELFVLMGLSGSGKSTLLRCLNRLNSVTSGEVHIGDTNVTGLSNKQLRRFRRKNVAMVFQHFALFPHRTVLENVAFGLEVQGVPRAEREAKALESLDMVQLREWANEAPESLSGGMRQRVGVARALAIEPEVLLMDEPFSALDPLIRSSMQEDLTKIRKELGKTIVFVTHDLDEALSLGDRIAILREGRIEQIGTPADIAVRPENDYIEAFVADVNRARVLKASDVMTQPVILLSPNDAPQKAIRRMDEHGFESALVRNEDGSLAGTLLMPYALQAAKAGRKSIREAITEAPAVRPDTPIEEVVGLVLDQGRHAAVLDARGTLLGIIRHKNLLPLFPGAKETADTDVEVITHG